MTHNPNRPQFLRKMIFARMSWMEHYQGVCSADQAINGGKFVYDEEYGAEEYNFLPVEGEDGKNRYYGYVKMAGGPTIDGKGLRLEHFGDHLKNANETLGVTVVFVATPPAPEVGMRVVGWYRKATLFRLMQTLPPNGSPYRMIALEENGHLLRLSERKFLLPDDMRPGQSHLWYGPKDSPKADDFYAQLGVFMDAHS